MANKALTYFSAKACSQAQSVIDKKVRKCAIEIFPKFRGKYIVHTLIISRHLP
ncbi:hypothetical protein SERLA73DRAFT_137983 [Serpula lacrymans var. lacrymans S7.3]|uniref:Uncharacterized protein n=1 Tax=Serpula lacrymans var. lacrymans (strain S7.3) TaxID=936435 RepID=F8Q0M3_SERL3|nr:hypothetical protein SERLA73DRAFT_137983 [Serpula lacrymans var. lacrymans S7.3]